MSQHKKDKDTRQRKNVDKENTNSNNNKNKNNSTKTNSAKTSGTNSSLNSASASVGGAGADKLKKTANNGALSAMNQKQQMKPLSKQQKEKLKAEREAIVIWRQPIKTLSYCSLEAIELVKTLAGK